MGGKVRESVRKVRGGGKLGGEVRWGGKVGESARKVRREGRNS